MKFRQNGVKYKYSPSFYKIEDDLKVNLPKYSLKRDGFMSHNGKWKKCRFYFSRKLGKTIVRVSPLGYIKDGISDLGQVDDQGFVERMKLSLYNRLTINFYDKLFFFKIKCIQFMDRVKPIRSNIRYIFFAVLGSTIYFLINHFFENYLQKLINGSNLAQSIIVFLSLSSIINIFHPFTFRKELDIKEVNELVDKKSKKANNNYDRYERISKKFNT